MRKKQSRSKTAYSVGFVEKEETEKQAIAREITWSRALNLFCDKGFEQNAIVQEIADAAGVGRRTFFRQFESKSDLMSYAVFRYAGLITGVLEKCPEGGLA